MFLCDICSKSFTRKFNVKRHVDEFHNGKKRDVRRILHTSSDLRSHELQTHKFETNGLGSQMISTSDVFDIRLKEKLQAFCLWTFKVWENFFHIQTFGKYTQF